MRRTQTKEPTQKEIETLKGIAHRVLKYHAAQVQLMKRDLAQHFDVPAQSIINAGFSQMGIDRFTRAGDDVWEMVAALESNEEYTRPARELVNRWACY